MSQRPSTWGALSAHGTPARSVKQEIAANAADRLARGGELVKGLVGFGDTVLPALETAVLAGHDLVLLGERGQAKSRVLRGLAGLLDDAVPAVDGGVLNDHPGLPVSPEARAIVAERGDDTPLRWLTPHERYAEKLATPDIAVADLIGDVDPIKVAEGRHLDDPGTIHYGLVPRHNRGIVTINELPDLAERIQVALLNIMEERDVQVRGYALRLPLDLLVVATANPEDYTNRGRIITPLKDRFRAEIRTHYPRELADEMAIMRAEANPVGGDGQGHGGWLPSVVVPDYLAEVAAAMTRTLRTSPEVNHHSGVSVRFSVAAYETLAASALRRAVRGGEPQAVARCTDLAAVISGGMGKIEVDDVEQGRESELLEQATQRAVLEVFRRRAGDLDLSGLVAAFADGRVVETGDLVTAKALLDQLEAVPGLGSLLAALGVDGEHPGMAASGLELALEGLHLTRQLDRTQLDDGSRARFQVG